MRRLTAEWLILRGTGSQAAGDLSAATRSFRLAATLAPSWETPHFHLGLIARQAGDWEVSFQSNQKAVALAGWPSDEALWNLGISATAVHNWAEARRAWRSYGFNVPEGQGELTMDMAPVCLRLNPPEECRIGMGPAHRPCQVHHHQCSASWLQPSLSRCYSARRGKQRCS